MRIGIDGMQLWGEWSGIGQSLFELLREFSREPEGDTFLLYTSRGFKRGEEIANDSLKVRRTIFSASLRTMRVMWQQLSLSRLASKQVDVLHAAAYIMPRVVLVPTVTTIHDTIGVDLPQFVRPSSASHLRRFLPLSIVRSNVLIAPTKAVANDIEQLAFKLKNEGLEIDPAEIAQKTLSIPFGVRDDFTPIKNETRRESVRKSFGISRPYILYVGRFERRKNIERIIQAFYASTASGKIDHELVLAGPDTDSRRARAISASLGISEKVHHMGYVVEEKLPQLFGAAELFVLPSFAEGFGMPVLEAMASGTPCVISNDAALKEVTGGAAVSVDAQNLAELRVAIEDVLLDRKAAADMRRRGLKRAGEFSWSKCARLTKAAYYKARSILDEA